MNREGSRKQGARHGRSLEAPAATGMRLPWTAVPPDVQTAVERELGSPIIEQPSQEAGFSPGVATRARLANGRRVFLKAVSESPNPSSPDIHRSEARIMAALPASVPAPRLLFSLDQDGWVVLALEDVDGVHPNLPWRSDDLGRVLDAVTALAAAMTPSPIAAPRLTETAESYRGWRTLLATGPSGLHPAMAADDWITRHLADLAGLEEGWTAAAIGDTLLHGDIRSDNILLTADGVVFVDWPWASIGPSWMDLLLFLPSVAMQGGPEPWSIFDSHRLAIGSDAAAVTSAVAVMAGYFVFQSGLTPPPGLPTLRPFQLAQAFEAAEWLKRRTGWP